MKTIQVTIDEPLLKALDKLSRVRKTTRSALIRDAVAAELRREERRMQESRHAQGYADRPVKAGEFDVWTEEQDWRAP